MGRDVADALGYFNISKAIHDHVSEDDIKTLKYKAYNVSGEASLWKGNDYSDKSIINESGLYSLILGSKLEKAKEFKHWVTAEVLPTIRKTGGYKDVADKDKLTEQIVQAGQRREMHIINESCLYSLLFSMQPQKANNDGASDAYPIETQQRIEN